MSSNTNVEKSFAQGLDRHTDRGRSPWSLHSRPRAKFFLYTDRRRPVFTLKCLVYDWHRARARKWLLLLDLRMTRAIKIHSKASHRLNMKISIHFGNFYQVFSVPACLYFNFESNSLDEPWKTGQGNRQWGRAISQDSGPDKKNTYMISTQLYFSLRYATLRYATLLYSTLLYSTLLYSVLPCSALLRSAPLCSPLPCSSLLCPAIPCPALPCPTLLYSILLYSTLLFSSLLFSSLPYSALL